MTTANLEDGIPYREPTRTVSLAPLSINNDNYEPAQ